MPMQEKARYFVAVLYPENMKPDWQDYIGDYLQLPYAYCIHNQDLTNDPDETRKEHVHCIIAFPNTTTYNHAVNVFERLNAPGKRSFNKVEVVINIRHMYDYLIHNTETCRKLNKWLYDFKERITGNCFDIGAFEQISEAEAEELLLEVESALQQLKYGVVWSNYYDEFSERYGFDVGIRKRLRANEHHFKSYLQDCINSHKLLS